METSIPRPCIVVGYDGSEPSNAAVTYAAERVGRKGRMFIVHAVGPVANWVGATGEQAVDENDRGYGRDVLNALMLDLGNVLMDRDFEVELVPGGAAHALCHVAEARDADEIVLGSRGQGRVGSLLGSVSEDVLRHAKRPVVVIPYEAVRERAEART
jgi:nucleotide-binding universal stress UspA family protein